ncbi:MAG TPA: restriction endonuclease [Thermoanaerobaculia bacterium]|nr:restriction endonuclease [Thermoanaerobaculia bacterium]
MWRGIDWQQFESLVFDYLRAEYGDTWTVQQTAEIGPDGGRDMELSIAVGADMFNTWVECKHYKEPIGLSTIGKSYIVVIANGVDRLMLMSSSPITDQAKAMFGRVARLQGRLRVDFRDGADLDSSLLRFPAIVKRHLGDFDPAPLAESLAAVVTISEFEEALSPAPVADETRLFEEQFFIHLRLKNRYAHALTLQSLTPPAVSAAIEMTLDALSPDVTTTLQPMEDVILTFFCRVLVPRATVELGELTIDYLVNGEPAASRQIVPLPVLNLQALRTPPLIGERVQTFLGSELKDLASAVKDGHGRIIDVRGGSGVGKSRILDEIRGRLRSQQFRALHYNALGRGAVVLRDLLADLTGLSITKGKLQTGEERIPELLVRRGCDVAFAPPIAKFLTGQSSLDESFYAITETLKHFISAPVHSVPMTVLIDNIQDLPRGAFELLGTISDHLRNTPSQTLLVLATNTDEIALTVSDAVSWFHKRLDSHPDSFRVRYDVQPLQKEDALSLLYGALRGLTEAAAREEEIDAEKPVLEMLVQKAGNRPLELLVTINWMETARVIERTATFDWTVPSFKRFREFVRAVPNDSAKIIVRRVAALRNAMPENDWIETRQLLRALVAFSGRIPSEYVSDRGADDAAYRLIERGVLAVDGESALPGYTAFHDNFYRYFSKAPDYRPRREDAQAVLEWIGQADPAAREELLLVEFFNAARARRDTGELLDAAERAVKRSANARRSTDTLEIGAEFVRTFERRSLSRVEAQRYLALREQYADALLHQTYMDEAVAEYDRVYAGLRYPSFPSSQQRDHFFHRYFNAKLHTARYREAAAVIEAWESEPPSSSWYEFAREDRKAGVHNAFGEPERSLEVLERALTIAKREGDRYAESIAYYDQGYVHIHLTHDVKSATESFERALAANEDGLGEAWRLIEIAQQRSLIALFKGEDTKALRYVTDGLELSKHEHLVIYDVKLLNLKAAIHVARDEKDEARRALLLGRSLALVYHNERAYWRAMGNLGALRLLEVGPRVAAVDLLRAEERMREWLREDGAFAMELPILANCLAACYGSGRDADVDRIKATWHHPRVKRWKPSDVIGIYARNGVGFLVT